MLLEISSLAFGFSEKILFNNLNLSIESGDRVAITGANGIGKTTLLRIIIGMYKPIKGQIKYQNKTIEECDKREIGRSVSYIPQSVEVYPELIAAEFFEDCKTAASYEQIQTLELQSLIDRPYRSLSGGEQQRVLLASALARKPQLVLVDELTQGVDKDYCLSFGEHIKHYTDTNSASLLLTTHDYEWAKKYCNKIFLLKDGELVNE